MAIFIRDRQRLWDTVGTAGTGLATMQRWGCTPEVPLARGHPGWLWSWPAGGLPPRLPRSSCAPASSHRRQQHLVLPGMPSLAVPSQPHRTKGVKEQTKPNCPCCTGCRSTAKNSASVPPALNNKISLQVTRVISCVHRAQKWPVPHLQRHHWGALF